MRFLLGNGSPELISCLLRFMENNIVRGCRRPRGCETPRPRATPQACYLARGSYYFGALTEQIHTCTNHELLILVYFPA